MNPFRSPRAAAAVLVAVFAAVGVASVACEPLDHASGPLTGPLTGPEAEPVVVETDDAAALLEQLVVAEEDTGAHYDRDEWHTDWAYHGDGCSTRELVLYAQAEPDASRGAACAPVCPVSGAACWTSPYDGRPTHDPGELQIDHRVSLKEASRSRVVDERGVATLGAARLWSGDQKRGFAEDPGNLVAVTGGVNQAKWHLDAGDWKPSLESAWCEYAVGYARTKIAYRLSVDQAERDGLAQMLATCPAGR